MWHIINKINTFKIMLEIICSVSLSVMQTLLDQLSEKYFTLMLKIRKSVCLQKVDYLNESRKSCK